MNAKMLLKVGVTAFVLSAVVITGLLAYHVWIDSLGRPFERFLPARRGEAIEGKAKEFVVEKSVPALDPGEQFYGGAREQIASGKLLEAKENLELIIANHPRSERVTEARRVLGEMNLDELLSAQVTDGKVVHTVRPGETYAKIAEAYRSDLDCLLHLNSIVDLAEIRVGQNLVVLPLDFRFVLEIGRGVISVWSGDRHVCEFAMLQLVDGISRRRGGYFIESKVADSGSLRPRTGTAQYRSAIKAVWLSKPALKIQGWDHRGDPPEGAVLLAAADMEELFLLMRPGNEVEIR